MRAVKTPRRQQPARRCRRERPEQPIEDSHCDFLPQLTNYFQSYSLGSSVLPAPLAVKRRTRTPLPTPSSRAAGQCPRDWRTSDRAAILSVSADDPCATAAARNSPSICPASGRARRTTRRCGRPDSCDSSTDCGRARAAPGPRSANSRCGERKSQALCRWLQSRSSKAMWFSLTSLLSSRLMVWWSGPQRRNEKKSANQSDTRKPSTSQ